MIQIQDLHKRFGRVRVLNGATCRVEAGQSVALWGPNGAGKTTLLRCVLGLIDFQGQIHIDGLDIRRHGKLIRRRVGYVPQEMAFYDDYRVYEVVRLIARLRGATRRDVAACLPGVGLQEHRRKRVRELSGGMKQRLALGLALLNDPPVLALDEPTSNLDSDARRELLGRLIGLKHAGKTILFISHRPEEVVGLADRVLTLEQGRVVADQSAELFASPGASDAHKPMPSSPPHASRPSADVKIGHGAHDQAVLGDAALVPACYYPEVNP